VVVIAVAIAVVVVDKASLCCVGVGFALGIIIDNHIVELDNQQDSLIHPNP
jgi:hypothetical protein